MEEPVTLPDGIFLAKGTHTAFPSPRALGAPDDNFHCGRVKAVRTPEKETRSQFSSTGLDYLSMGHGRTACPGRFFASVEIKICFIHLLLKYDWKAVGQIPLGAEVREFVPEAEPILAFKARDAGRPGLYATRNIC